MNGLLTDRCTIRKATEATSGSGEVKDTYADLTLNVPCSIQPRSGYLRHQDAGEVAHANYFGVFRRGVDIDVDYHVVHNGVTYLVTFKSSLRNHHIEVDLTSKI